MLAKTHIIWFLKKILKTANRVPQIISQNYSGHFCNPLFFLTKRINKIFQITVWICRLNYLCDFPPIIYQIMITHISLRLFFNKSIVQLITKENSDASNSFGITSPYRIFIFLSSGSEMISGCL